ncbi:non-canonical purine NTP pyrophosphatase [uncultured Tateyamaria sp.]|uniref:non-canonical purine NTP pyrophosphatase n=1 Tax=uncultured Tateyamaria sp. TaxID=455651 RepID=UPI002618F732|nr:non-canonical purine NTP pyrophosphatase [uncultured Tateyamaria sp.]
MRALRFLSGNPHKIREVEDILSGIDIEIVAVDYKISEIQTIDVPKLVHGKCIRAFQRVSQPIFVEHTSLKISALNGFPGGLTQVFWDTLQADNVSKLFGSLPDPTVVASTRIAFCDGKRIHQFEGEVEGSIAAEPRGNRDFQWDCVFVPKGETETFAELGDRKNEISMRRRALESFAEFLKVKIDG